MITVTAKRVRFALICVQISAFRDDFLPHIRNGIAPAMAYLTSSSPAFSQKRTAPSHLVSKSPIKLIFLAWLIEGVAVLVSASLAVHPLLGVEGEIVNKWLGAAPFLVIAFAELAKIPIVEAMFRLKGTLLPCIAAFTALLICLNTFYTVSNGFERAHATKTKNIAAVEREIADIKRREGLVDGEGARLRLEKKLLHEQLADINRREQEEISAHTERFKIGAQAGKNVSSSVLTEIYNKYTQQRKPISDQLANLNSQLDSRNTSSLVSNANDAKARLSDLIHENQIYRLAAMFYNYDDPTKMTAKELNTFCFVWFGLIAFAVSTLGPLLATCYYRIKYPATIGRTAWNDLLRAARRTVIRLARRKKIVKIRDVERIVDRPVEVPVEVVREVVKEVPVPTVITEVREVVKEVPVDRIVPIEKPVEVKVKELIYVPIFTNDPDVLKDQLIQ